MQFEGSPVRYSWNTSADGFGWVRLDSVGDALCADVNYPEAGSYQIHAAVRATSLSSDMFMARIEPAVWLTWDVEDQGVGDWRWSHVGPVFSAVSAGIHRTCVGRFENMDLDAIWIRKVP
jgi:hypothetical protein